MKEQVIDILKKFWFVILVGVIFISFAIYFAWDTNKDRIPGKSADGKDVIFSTDDYNYTADSLYKSLYNTETNGTKAGIVMLYTLLENEVANSVEVDDAMEEEVETNLEMIETQWKQQYGDAYESYLEPQLKSLGYDSADDLEEFLFDQAKLTKLVADYIDKNPKLFDDIYSKKSPREVSHILVKCADADNPTKEEKAKMEKVEKALANKEKFTSVAKKYSDDTNSAIQGGRLGVQLKDSLVEEFGNAAWNLKVNETSDWVKSEFGYHLIVVNNTDKDKMLKKEANKDSIQQLISTEYPNLRKEVVWKTAKKLGVECKDKETKAALMKYIGVEK